MKICGIDATTVTPSNYPLNGTSKEKNAYTFQLAKAVVDVIFPTTEIWNLKADKTSFAEDICHCNGGMTFCVCMYPASTCRCRCTCKATCRHTSTCLSTSTCSNCTFTCRYASTSTCTLYIHAHLRKNLHVHPDSQTYMYIHIHISI